MIGWLRRLFDRWRRRPASGSAPLELREGWFERWLEETRFLQRYPHYAGTLSRFELVSTATVDTMAVTLKRWDDPEGRLQLLVNVGYFQRHPGFRAGILLHELQHVSLGHLSSRRLHAVARPRLMELAMELSANEGIREPAPPGFEIAEFTELGIRPGQSTLERYHLLSAAYDAGKLRPEAWWSSSMRDAHRPRCEGQGAGLGDLLEARSDGASSEHWSGRRGLGAPTHRLALELMKKHIASHLRGERGGDDDWADAGRERKAKEIERVLLPSRSGQLLDWRRLLREAFPAVRAVRPDYLRPNRRFKERIGEVPGRVRRPPRPRMLVAVDTSGSIGSEVLARVSREVQALRAHAQVTVVECDAAVHRVYRPQGLIGPVLGGGDTDFGPVFGLAQRSRFEGVVYFTDGKGLAPAHSPLPTLWVLTHAEPWSAPFGTVARLYATTQALGG